MPAADTLIAPLNTLLDRIIPEEDQRDKAKLQLLLLQGSQELQALQTKLSAILAEASSPDPWVSRARPGFLYVMYAMILWALPMGLLSALSPATALAVSQGMTAYLNGIPEPLYTLFATGYLGYTAARQWGKIAGKDR